MGLSFGVVDSQNGLYVVNIGNSTFENNQAGFVQVFQARLIASAVPVLVPS
jgi:hypothetical protein